MRHWYKTSFLSFFLLPLALLFGIIVAVRRAFYQAGIFRSTRLPVPVIVVGNISVGGTGKTPLVIWLAEYLRTQGFHPGIISRGYKGNAGIARAVSPHDNAGIVGDEPALLAQRTNVPVYVFAKRAAAARALLAAHPEVNVILSDDGLQHYALARDVEIAVIDGARGFGNGFLLPAGPLREPQCRLARVDAIVMNGAATKKFEMPASVPTFEMSLLGATFHNLREPALQAAPPHFKDKEIHAFAAIGNPQRFFDHVRTFGLAIHEHPFPDHYAYTAQDFAGIAKNAIVLMTEKDAVKCRHFAHENFWALRVNAAFNAGFGEHITNLLKKK